MTPAPATHSVPAPSHPQVAVSVIIPAYNIVRYLEACVRSVLRQTWRDFELILVDDGSTDGTATLCDRLAAEASAHGDAPAVRVLHRPNGGPAAARNAGLDAARAAEAIAFIDGDDVVHERYLAVLVDALRRSGADVVQAPFVLLGEADRPRYDAARLARPLPVAARMHSATATEALADMLYQRPGRFDSSLWGKMFRRDLFYGLRLPEQWHVYEDLYTMAQLLGRSCDVVLLSSPVYFYFKQADGTLNTRSVVRSDAFDVCDALIALMQEHHPALVSAARSRKLSVAFNILRLLSASTVPSASAEIMARRCWLTVRALRCGCLADPNVRAKSKVGILLSYAGRRLTMACFRLFR